MPLVDPFSGLCCGAPAPCDKNGKSRSPFARGWERIAEPLFGESQAGMENNTLVRIDQGPTPELFDEGIISWPAPVHSACRNVRLSRGTVRTYQNDMHLELVIVLSHNVPHYHNKPIGVLSFFLC